MSVYDRTVITGGGGMLAAALRQTLERRGAKPHVLSRGACDITDAQSVDDLFELQRPTLVLNCAAYTKVDLAEKETDLANRVNGAFDKLIQAIEAWRAEVLQELKAL